MWFPGHHFVPSLLPYLFLLDFLFQFFFSHLFCHLNVAVLIHEAVKNRSPILTQWLVVPSRNMSIFNHIILGISYPCWDFCKLFYFHKNLLMLLSNYNPFHTVTNARLENPVLEIFLFIFKISTLKIHFFFIFCVNVYSYLDVCAPHVYMLSYGWQKIVPDFLELEVQMVVSSHVGVGTTLQSSVRTGKAEPSLQPLLLICFGQLHSFSPLPPTTGFYLLFVVYKGMGVVFVELKFESWKSFSIGNTRMLAICTDLTSTLTVLKGI